MSSSEIANSLRGRPWNEPISPFILERAADEIERLVEANATLRRLLNDRHRLDPVAIADTLAALDATGSTVKDWV